MKTHKEINEEMHQDESSHEGWVGRTNVELARKIYAEIWQYMNPAFEVKEETIFLIAKCLKENRTY